MLQIKKLFKTIALTTVLAATTIISGCASVATPSFYNGNYYMAGDESCARISVKALYTINCFKADGTPTGYRRAMTQQQLDMYMHNQDRAQRSSIAGNAINTRRADDARAAAKVRSDAITKAIMENNQ